MTWSNVFGCYSFERLKKQVILCIFHCFICQEGLVADFDLNNIYQKCKQNPLKVRKEKKDEDIAKEKKEN